jgi:hypothetical protein
LKKQLSSLQQRIGSGSSGLKVTIDETLIPIFDPGTDNQNASDWVRKVDDLMSFYNWDERIVVKMATNRLRGNARKWYDSLPSPCLKWREMKCLIIKNFPTPVQFGRHLVDAANYAPQPNQTLSDYCFEKVSKLNQLKLDIPPEYMIDSIIEGINDENLKLSLRAASFKTVGEVASYLRNIPNRGGGGVSSAPPSRSTTGISHKNFNRFGLGNSSKYDRKDELNHSNHLSCFNCRGSHMVRDCPKPLIECVRCRKLGHREENCQLAKI